MWSNGGGYLVYCEYELGMLFTTSINEKHMNAKFEELKTIAEQGDAKAMLELGNCYFQGKGTDKHLTDTNI